MFGLFSKELKLVAPISGKTVDLSAVPDPVFAEKMTGDGIAIDPTGDLVLAPADGELTLVFKTKHALAMTLSNGIELLIHIGMDTVSLDGEGFELLCEQGAKVKAGTPLLKIDREFIKSKNLPLVTPIVITNMDSVKSLNPSIGQSVEAGKDTILTYKTK